MRQRTLKPGFFKNEDLGAMSAHERLLFAGLFLIADRSGRFEDRPSRIKAEVFPYDEGLDIEAMLARLAGCGFIVRYTSGGKRYGVIPTFNVHQNPHPKEPASLIPSPDSAVNGNGDTMVGNVRPLSDRERTGSSGSSGSSGPSGPTDARPSVEAARNDLRSALTIARQRHPGKTDQELLAMHPAPRTGAVIDLERCDREDWMRTVAARLRTPAKKARKGDPWGGEESPDTPEAQAVAWVDARPIELGHFRDAEHLRLMASGAPEPIRGAVAMILFARNPQLRTAFKGAA